MRPFIVLILVLLAIAVLPTWPYMGPSAGYWPTAILALVVCLVVAAIFVKPGTGD